MKLKRLLAIFVVAMMLLTVVPSAGIARPALDNEVQTVTYNGTYYTDNGYNVSTLLSESGSTLFGHLASLMTDTQTYVTTNSEIRDMFYGSDADPDVAGNFLTFYSRVSYDAWDSNVMSREHVWPKSYLSSVANQDQSTDLHHIRPELNRINTSRSNHLMAWIDTATKPVTNYYNNDEPIGSYLDTANDLFEPCDSVKGDVARIYFYLATRWGEDLTQPVYSAAI